jgi:hypothetical protein
MIRNITALLLASAVTYTACAQGDASAPLEPLKPIAAQSPQATPQTVLPANTEVVLSMNEDLTTKGGNIEEGTMFNLTVVSDVKLGDLVVIPKGSRGAGEVTWKTGKGAFGKSGKMDVELRYVEVGGQRIPIEGKYRQEGEGNTVATVGTVLLAGVFAGFVTGKSAKIPRGRELSARTKVDVPVALPVAAKPAPVEAVPAALPAQASEAPAPTN